MTAGKAFELFVKRILIHIGFSEVKSDMLYIFDGPAGQMLQGLGEAHNADVLLEPPVQTPFYSRTRLLIECKDYHKKVGLNTVRSALGLKEDINNFNVVDAEMLRARRAQRRQVLLHDSERYSYQVAVASLHGYTRHAQAFAAAYRIPLLQFNRLPFWDEFCRLLEYENHVSDSVDVPESLVEALADRIGERMALAITSSGQILFLYHEQDEKIKFGEYYTLHWESSDRPWRLCSGNQSYLFQLPEDIMKQWLANATDELNMKKRAIHCKMEYLSNMVVYYSQGEKPVIQMISIDMYQLEKARSALGE